MRNKRILIGACVSLMAGTSAIGAGPIDDRLEEGKPIRIAYANVPVFSYPDESGEAKGFGNEVTLAILKEMGIDNVETTVTEWGGLIPGLNANRYDIISGGMYIAASRCKNVMFSDPIAKTGDAFLVPRGNPKGIHTYKDILEKGATLITYSGALTVENAKKEGVPDSQILQVPGSSEVKAAVTAGRADAGGTTYFEIKALADASNGELEATDPNDLPEWSQNYVSIAFRHDDKEFLTKFNEALKDYIGSDQMMAAVEPYGLTDGNLPGDTTAEWACANR